MSKQTKSSTTSATKGGTKPVPTPAVPAKPTSANDTARAEALAKLNAAPAANARKPSRSKPPTTRPSSAKPSAPKPSLPRSKARTGDAAKRLSALDAAAKVLVSLPAKEARTGLGANELIDRMAASGLWTSPGGKTPAATLYAAMIREIASKGDAARFVRLDATDGGTRGRFAASPAKAATTRNVQTQKTKTQKAPSRKGAA